MSDYEKAARAAGFTVRTFGRVQKIARTEKDGKYVVSDKGWRYACEDANIHVSAGEKAPETDAETRRRHDREYRDSAFPVGAYVSDDYVVSLATGKCLCAACQSRG